MQALLNITDYVVDELIIKSNPDYRKSDREQKGELHLGFDLKRKGKEPLFMITMEIELNKAQKALADAPYYVLLKIRGFFDFMKGTDEETMQKMIGLNGLAMLYGVSRGVVGQATANCTNGKLVLPSVNFVELVKKEIMAKSKGARKKTMAAAR